MISMSRQISLSVLFILFSTTQSGNSNRVTCSKSGSVMSGYLSYWSTAYLVTNQSNAGWLSIDNMQWIRFRWYSGIGMLS